MAFLELGDSGREEEEEEEEDEEAVVGKFENDRE
jgi:hypothetical protein